MNADHKQALVMLARTFCSYRLNGSNDDRSRSPRLSCPLETAEGMPGARIAFLREVSNQSETRKVLVEMVQQARSQPNEFLI